MFNAHVIEHRAHHHLRACAALFDLPWQERAGREREVDAAHGFKHGWYFDAMAGENFKNDGGRGIVWCDQPYMD